MTITSCIFSSVWAGFRTGETTGDIRDVTISNCIFNYCNDAIKIQSMENGIIENFYISNCIIRNTVRPFFITATNFRLCKDAVGGIIPENGKLRNINISDTYVEMPPKDFVLVGRAPPLMYSSKPECYLWFRKQTYRKCNFQQCEI